MIESLVSVIIPCFNHADELPRAVSSVLLQRYLHEIIIIDDCSSDNSFQVAERLAGIDPRIAVFRTKENSGPASARNLGARFATGHYLSFLDADDEYLDEFLLMSVAALEASTEMQAVKTWVEFLGDSGEPVLAADDPRVEALVFSLPGNMVLLTEAFRKLGGFPENPVFRKGFGGEDVAFNQAVAKYLTPLGRIETVGYRIWCQPGDHLDRFLGNTEVKGHEFSFIDVADEQKPGGVLDVAIEAYLASAGKRMA